MFSILNRFMLKVFSVLNKKVGLKRILVPNVQYAGQNYR